MRNALETAAKLLDGDLLVVVGVTLLEKTSRAYAEQRRPFVGVQLLVLVRVELVVAVSY